MNHEKISWVNFFRTILTIALPIAFQNFLSTTASMVDTIMIGSQGELSVAAVIVILFLLLRVRKRRTAVFLPVLGRPQ